MLFRHLRNKAGVGNHPSRGSGEFEAVSQRFRPHAKSEKEKLERRADTQRRYQKTRIHRDVERVRGALNSIK